MFNRSTKKHVAAPFPSCYVLRLLMCVLHFEYSTLCGKKSTMATPPLRDYKIAVIEDDLSIRDMYSAKLELSGFTVCGASNGVEGLAVAERARPDVILLDLMMPEMNGDEMLQRLRSEEWGADMHVIILTNLSKDEAPHALRLLSVDRYIVKAYYTPAQIVEVVKEVLHIK
jgi:twitching motility two-component system response regulator PilH